MNPYYLTLVLDPNLSEADRKSVLDGVKKKMVGADGKVIKEDIWGERDLAYSIKRKNKGYYVHFEFETEPKIAKDLDKVLKVEEDILRYLLVRR